MSYKRWSTTLVAAVLALGLVAVPGYAADKLVVKTPRTHATHATVHAEKKFDSRAAMILAANDYFKNSPVPVISAVDLFEVVQIKDAGYQIVDVRSPEHFALGHIDGAINIPFGTIADDASLAKLDNTKTIVTVCYTGETASMTNMVWNMLGYDTTTLLFGMSGWVADKAIVGLDFPSGIAAGYPTTTATTTTTKTYRAPKLDAKYADVASAIKGQTRAYSAKNLAPVMTAAEVNAVVQSKDPRYQIVSVRETADYAKGHLSGASNIVWTDIADQMRRLDPEKTTIVYCYTGNIGGQVAMFLNLMGYETYNMMSGMASWNNDSTVGGFVGYDPAIVANYYTVK